MIRARTVRSLWQAMLLTVVVAVVSACSPGGPTGIGSCNQAGCSSAVSFDADAGLFVEGSDYLVEVCVDGECTETQFSAYGAPPVTDDTLPRVRTYGAMLPDGDYAGADEVRLTITTTDGEPVAEALVPAEFERMRPNGPDCPPICWTMYVAL